MKEEGGQDRRKGWMKGKAWVEAWWGLRVSVGLGGAGCGTVELGGVHEVSRPWPKLSACRGLLPGARN